MKKLFSTFLALVLVALPLAARAGDWQYISVVEGALLREGEPGEYPATLTMGEQQFEAFDVLNALGNGWTLLERDEYMGTDAYRSAGGEEPWEYKHAYVYYETGTLSYYDPSVTGERGAEYEAQHMNMLPSESVSALRVLLDGAVDADWLSTPDPVSAAHKRWRQESGRWMTDAEYDAFYTEAKSHYFSFAHMSGDGIPIQADRVFANVGVNGLAGLELDWHEWSESDKRISPMPLEEAITMANSTRECETLLYYADLVYSNWLTGSSESNLCWYLATSNGNYIVDCVLKKHMCDSYEY